MSRLSLLVYFHVATLPFSYALTFVVVCTHPSVPVRLPVVIAPSRHHCRSAEVLHQTGVLDYHDIMEDHHDALTKVKDTCMKQADYFRVSVRRRLNPSAIQAWVEQEKMAAMGLASGALVGLVL